jgi:tetratricopeptide (TPR) repeat protein
MASATRAFVTGVNQPAQPAASENKDWMRWNNYGVALLDDRQYAASVDAFSHVAALRPDYADAYTNIAIARLQSEQYDEALPWLMKSLGLAPGNARALYYLALFKRNKGDLDGSIEALQKVAMEFPRSRDVHRELGFDYYQQQRYELACAEYEALQSIDPDDLSAHYNLSILYRRLGLKDKAPKQASYFADQKDDPTASIYALQYLGQHPEVAQENLPLHIHDLDANRAFATSIKIRKKSVDTTPVSGR